MTAIAYSPDGSVLAMAGRDFLALHVVASGARIATADHYLSAVQRVSRHGQAPRVPVDLDPRGRPPALPEHPVADSRRKRSLPFGRASL